MDMLEASPPPAQAVAEKASERRIAPRYPLTAFAELVELRTGMRLKARTTDISEGGCYVDAMSPFSSGVLVQLRIAHKNRVFESRAVVRYSQPGLGMGLQFHQAEPAQMQVLLGWIAELSDSLAPVLNAPEIAPCLQEFTRSDRYVLSQLVSLLIRKRILSEHEGGSLLRELIS